MTDTIRVAIPKPQTVIRTVTQRVRVVSPTPAKAYSGNGGKSLGTLEFPGGATLKWTNDGGLFQILTAGPNPVRVKSQAQSGETELAAGMYPNFRVNAMGKWTIRIVEH